MANAGRVELNIAAVGEDKLSAMLGKLDGQLNATKARMEGVASTTNNVGSGVAALSDKVKSSIGGVDKMRSAFELLRSNAMFLTAGLGSVVAGLGSLLASVTSGAYSEWVESSRKLPESFERVANAIRDVDVLLGNAAAATAYEKAANALAAEFDKLTDELNKARAAQREQDRWIEQFTQKFGAEHEATKSAMLDLQVVLDAIVRLEAERERIAIRQTQLVQAQRIDLTAIAQGNLARTGLDALLANRSQAATGGGSGGGSGGGRRGGGGRSREAAPQGSTIAMSAELIRDMETPWLDLERIAMDAGPNINALFGAALNDNIIDGWAALRDEISSTTDTMLGFLGTIEQAANAAFPELGAGLQELAAITEDYQGRVKAIDDDVANKRITAMEAQGKVASETATAVIGGSTAVLAGLAKELGGLREYYAVKAAGELAAGFATAFTNPAESVSHFTAATMYGVAAAKAGGGGGGSASGGGGKVSTGSGSVGERSSSGPVIFNFATLVTDRAQVRRAVGQVMARRDRSGYSGRGGA